MIRRFVELHRESPGARASALMVAAIGGASVGGYLFHLIAIRWLGAADYAEVAALTSLTLLVVLPLVSIQNAVGRDVAHLVAYDRTTEVRALFRRWLSRTLLVSLILGGAVFAATPLIQDRLGVASPLTVLLTAVGIAVSTLLPVTHGLLQGLQRFGWFAASILAFALARPLLAPPLILIGGVTGALAATALGAVVPLAINAVGIRRALRRLPKTEEPIPNIGTATLLPALLGVTAFTVLTNVDVLVAKAALSAHEAGNYASAALFGKAVLFAASGITLVLLPRATTYLVGEGTGITRAARRSLVTVSFLGVTSAAMLAPVPESVVVWLFGPTFGNARDLLAPFALTMTVAAVAQVVLTISLATGERRYPALLGLVAAADVAALAVFHGSAFAILGVTAIACGTAVAGYEAVAEFPLRRLLRQGDATRPATESMSEAAAGRAGSVSNKPPA